MSDPDRSSGPDPDEFGTLEQHGDHSILRFERRLAHPPERVWRALTEEAELAAWFPTTIEGERRVGAPLGFSFRRGEGAPFAGEMLAFVPPSLMELRWTDDVLRFELEPCDGAGASGRPGCVLRLQVTFPEHKKAARDGAGWHVCLHRLASVCDDDASSPDEPRDLWRMVHAQYVERLGPEASVIGPPQA